MSQKHQRSPDSIPESSDGVNLPLAASILHECWTEGRKILGNGDDYPLVCKIAQQLIIEPSSDIRAPVDSDQDRTYVIGLVKRHMFSVLRENDKFNVFWAWTPSKKEEAVWMFDCVGYHVCSEKRNATMPLVDAARTYRHMVLIAMHYRAAAGDMRRRLWSAGLCMCPDTHRLLTVAGDVYVMVVVRDSVAKKLNDNCPGSFTPFHAN
jgi:hypothetical protein